MAVEFYDVKTRAKVSVDDSKITKTTFTANGQTRYGLRGKTEDGRNLTKFVSKGDWDSMPYSEEATPAKESTVSNTNQSNNDSGTKASGGKKSSGTKKK